MVPRAYTSNMEDDPADIVRRNVWHLISKLFPGFLISHRSALEFQISPGGYVYVTASARRVYRWPGVKIRIAEGPDPIESDSPFYETLFASSLERACLENLSVSRSIDGERRTVEQEVVENRLLDILNTRGEEALNTFRDVAQGIADQLEMSREFEILNHIVGSLLSTQPSKILKSPVATAHALGEPYDSGRIELFHLLASELMSRTLPTNQSKTDNEESFSNFAFYEAYFSNYIEGTTFLLEEAVDIIYNNTAIPLRTEDTHDIKGTFQICSDRSEMYKIPTHPNELIDLLRRRHAILLGGRRNKQPGAFKSQVNRAGNTIFVEPRFVTGTLKMGFSVYQGLEDPVARALFMMFLISEVHPFTDGNGRIARIMMNAELVHGGISKIIIPTVFREDYMLALRRLTRKRESRVYIDMMIRAHAFSHWLIPTDFNIMRNQLEISNAFNEPDEDGSVLRWKTS